MSSGDYLEDYESYDSEMNSDFPEFVEEASGNHNDCFHYNTDYQWNDVGESVANNPEACQHLCINEPKCNYWTLNQNNNRCLFKSVNTGSHEYMNAVSGPKFCGQRGNF